MGRLTGPGGEAGTGFTNLAFQDPETRTLITMARGRTPRTSSVSPKVTDTESQDTEPGRKEQRGVRGEESRARGGGLGPSLRQVSGAPTWG